MWPWGYYYDTIGIDFIVTSLTTNHNQGFICCFLNYRSKEIGNEYDILINMVLCIDRKIYW